ncbi:hypothetical protein B0H16DRAFT_1782883 [Mycena metata]|uniref:F-box domain-containing protein n=1 Tax=Mycena metata TaxID=1033252 RepID=A0AAD7KGE9_9AGAR|nr:hypothetical protein B0H16DRAFT_1721955 [Mycena metata]KAJ7784128.1 hypothetical protein B0H16DRAFT_1782883 [Mycena metata]
MSGHADLRSRLAEVDASIAELHLRLKPLQDARKQLQSQLDGIVYPVVNLPPEITSNIFLRCLLPSPELSSPVKTFPSTSTAPLLFSNLEELPMEMDEDELEKRIADWFGRAGTCPLSLSVRGSMGMGTFGSDAISAIIRHHAPQLQSICLQLDPAHFEAIAAVIGPFPILETLAVALPFQAGEDEDSLAWKIFSNAPRLSQLSFSENAIPSMFRPSNDTLVKVTCEVCPADDFLSIMRNASVLREFECSIEPDDLHPYSDSDIISHEHLHTLHLLPYCFYRSLRLLRLPALQNLRISEDIHLDETRDFRAFLARSSASLRSFSASCVITTLTVDWFATSMPGLTEIELNVQDHDILYNFFKRLYRTENPGFLPHLQSLIFRDWAFSMTASMFRALSSRTIADDQTSILSSFRQIWPKGDYMILEDATAASFRGLVERGMKIHVGPAHRSRI